MCMKSIIYLGHKAKLSNLGHQSTPVPSHSECNQTQCFIYSREFCSSCNCKPSKFSCIFTVHLGVYNPCITVWRSLWGQKLQEITSPLLPGCLISFASAVVSIMASFCLLAAAAALNNWKSSSACSHGAAPCGIFALHMFVQHTHTHTHLDLLSLSFSYTAYPHVLSLYMARYTFMSPKNH